MSFFTHYCRHDLNYITSFAYMKKWGLREFFYQLAIVVVLFVFFSFKQDYRIGIEAYKVSFFLNYMVAAFVINYILLPRLYYRKKLVQFAVSVVVVITLVILVDEFILEQVYFPDTRGAYFPGLIFTLGETLPIIIIFVAFKFAWDFIKKQSEIEDLKALARENELQFLKSQINPHFLFNNLNNLYAYAIEQSPKTPSIILELSSVLRYMLYECNSKQVDLTNEIKHLRDYTALNELRIEDHGVVTFNSRIEMEGLAIAPLLLIVFVENAFKHTTSSQSDNILIHIAVDVDKFGVLDFRCKNSYLPGANHDHLANGIGLVNVKKQLMLLYPDNHSLEVIDDGSTFEVLLKLHLNPSDHA